jgi:hypothetical protein
MSKRTKETEKPISTRERLTMMSFMRLRYSPSSANEQVSQFVAADLPVLQQKHPDRTRFYPRPCVHLLCVQANLEAA